MTEPRPRPRPRPVATEPADVESATVTLTKDRPAAGGARTPRPAPGKRGARAATWLTGRVVALAVLAVVVIAFAAVNIAFLVKRDHNSDVESARTAATAAVRTRLPALLSYNYKTLDTYKKVAPPNATGAFRKSLSQLIESYIAANATANQIVTKATVAGVGVISAKPDSVVLLVLVNQSSTSKAQTKAQTQGSRLRVTMTRTGGAWLVSDLTQT